MKDLLHLKQLMQARKRCKCYKIRYIYIKGVYLTRDYRSVYKQLLTFFHNRAQNPDDREIEVDSEKLSEVFPHITNTAIPQLMVSDKSLRITAVLLKLYNEGAMTLQNLITYVDDFTRTHVVSSETTQTIIYGLVADDLIVIDRQYKDSLVKLKL